MAYKRHILLGKITKVHGYEGALTIRLERNFSDNIPRLESVFVETDGRPVPFFIDVSEQPDHSTLRLKFKDYNSAEKVREFVGCKIYLTGKLQSETPADDPESLVGYEVFSEENHSIGIITGITENPGQFLLNINAGSGKKILLPLHDDLIDEIDTEKKVIRMIIPDGITEIN